MILSLRFPLALLLAFTTTSGLFLLMKSLIETDAVYIEHIDSIIIDLVKPLEMKPIEPTAREIKPPPKPETPPPSPEVSLRADGPGFLPLTTTGPIKIPNDTEFGISDGEYLPLVRIQPAYPRRAASRGIEGYAVVEFDISAAGLVEHPHIVDAYPSDIFNRAALSAIARFKYKPKVQNGIAQRVSGAQNRFSFKMAQN